MARKFTVNALVPAALLAWLSGCASITGTQEQPVRVVAVCEGAIIAAVSCTIKNDKGQWSLEAPGSVVIKKSYEELTVSCAKAKSAGSASFISKNNGGAWGNALAGGIIGFAVDSRTGAGFDYPGQLPVVLSSPCPDNLAENSTTTKKD